MVNLEKIKPENLWYVVGLIATDGNLSGDKRHINITSKDRDYLFSVRDALGLTCKIGLKGDGGSKEKKYSVLQFSDVHFYRYLESIGFFPRKSLTLGKIEINDFYFRDFLRGVIDGDGCLRGWINRANGYQQWSISIASAASIFIEWLKWKIENQFHIQGRLYTYRRKHAKNPMSTLKFGKLAAKIIITQCYYDGSLSLGRKLAMANLCLQDANRMVNYGGVLWPGW